VQRGVSIHPPDIGRGKEAIDAHDMDDGAVARERVPVERVKQDLRDRLEQVLGLLLPAKERVKCQRRYRNTEKTASRHGPGQAPKDPRRHQRASRSPCQRRQSPSAS